MIKLLLTTLFLIVFSLNINCQDDLSKNFANAEPWPWPWPETTTTPEPGPSKEECDHNIYSGCNVATQFTSAELELVRQFLNHTFKHLADIKPDVPLCPSIRVRRDWKCLTQQQRRRVINVWQQLYANNVIQNLTDIQTRYWPAWHQTAEHLPAHRWLNTELEQYMQAIDNRVTLPYWCPWVYGSQPERSSIWHALGHNGNYSNGYSVTDGIYKDLVPSQKRHWSYRNTIYPWASPELDTNLLHYATTYTQFMIATLQIYFQPYMAIGGKEGQYSTTGAPYDILYFMQNNCEQSVRNVKWQLSRKENLTPLSYNLFTGSYNPQTGCPQTPDINKDKITGVPCSFVKQQFWLGFGDNCAVADVLIKAINNLVKGVSEPTPIAVQRMPDWVIRKHFQYFVGNSSTFLLNTYEDVGNCNRECLALPKPTFLYETEVGRRVRSEFGAIMDVAELHAYRLWYDLNKSGYCSPYVTKY